jgi:uncharacterized protein YkvS
VNLQGFANKVKSNSKVSDIIFIEDVGDPFETEIRIGLSLVDGGVLTLEYHKTKSLPYIELFEIGDYRLSSFGVKLKNNKWEKWVAPHSISFKNLNEFTDLKVHSIDDIIFYYDEILSFVEKIYTEPQVPIDMWEMEKMNSYTGYLASKTIRVKIYVTKIENSNHYRGRAKNEINEMREAAEFLFRTDSINL